MPFNPDDAAIEHTRSLLQTARGQALDAYSGLEQILMEVFCYLIDANLGRGGIVFFRLASVGLRNRVIADLIESKHGTKFNAFWFGTDKEGGLLTILRQVDQRRNEIVHWKPVYERKVGEFVLRPPNLWHIKPNYPFITIDDIYEFIAKADCVRHYAGNFNWLTTRYREGDDSAHARAWLDKFEQPPAYPPPTGHPLFQMWQERRTRPKSFQA